MKKLLLFLSLLLCAPTMAQQTVPLPISGLPGNLGYIPFYLPPQGGAPVMGPSNLQDNGNQLLYKGSPVSSQGSNENLSFSATPIFSISTSSSRIVLSGNITTFTLAAGSDGQSKCLEFTHDATSTAYTVTPPGNVLGFMGIGSSASKRNLQCFTYFVLDSAWVAQSPGVINQ